jgi:copper chaperone CopZ
MCVKHVSEALQTVPGTHDVEVDLQAGTANFMYDPGLVTDEQLKEAVEEAGYELEGSLP